jgi:hypothetical protein
MDALRTRGQCTPKQLARLNVCRMYLRVARLSEIAIADGKKLTPAALKGTDAAIHLSEARWLRGERPPRGDWTFWSKKLRAVFSKDGEKPPLRTPLGMWKPTLDQREWNTLVSAQTSPREVFRRLPDGSYEVFEEVITRKSSYSFWVSSTVTKVTDTLPFDAVPAEMQVTKQKRERCKIIHRG